MSTPVPVQTKFATRDFSGNALKFFLVTSEVTKKTKAVKAPTHHIIALDRSGSMYYDIDSAKATIEKVLTLSEFDDPSLRVSVISYSSHGDVKVHFNRVTVAEVMAPNSAYLREVRSIRATAMTCISQALVTAKELVNTGEATCITLHTDGFANDSSPSVEARSIQAAVLALKAYPNVFVNTIAYRDYCDFTLLSSIANQLSGKCIQARDIKQVYTALYEGTALLAGSMSPAVEVGLGNADYAVFVSKSGRKIIGSSENTMTIRGLSAEDDTAVYRYRSISQDEYNALSVPVNGVNAGSDPILAYCRSMIAERRLNEAKFALSGSGHTDLLVAHYKDMVSSAVAGFAASVENVVFGPSKMSSQAKYGLPFSGASVLQVLNVLNQHSRSLSVDIENLKSGYKRRGLRRVAGVRLADGTLEKPRVESRIRSRDTYVKVNGFEVNRDTATVNMLLSQPIDLYNTADNTPITEVAGISLSGLSAFNNYTLVGDGSVNVESVRFKTDDKRTFRDLRDIGVVSGEFEPNNPFTVNFGSMPVVDFGQDTQSVTQDQIRDLARLTVLSKILSGLVKGESVKYTPEQVSALKDNYLTASLNFAPPTTTEYTDLKDAIANGTVDTRLSYKITVGLPSMTSVSNLKSGNEYLQRRFSLQLDGKVVEKPTLSHFGAQGTVWSVKPAAKLKLDEVDNISYPIYEGFLGLGDSTAYRHVLSLAHIVPDEFEAALRGGDREKTIEVVNNAIHSTDRAIESVYSVIRPLAFYVGSTGLVPDSLGATAYDAESLVKAHPDTKLSKKEKEEGSFYLLPSGALVTVYTESVNFTVDRVAA